MVVDPTDMWLMLTLDLCASRFPIELSLFAHSHVDKDCLMTGLNVCSHFQLEP